MGRCVRELCGYSNRGFIVFANDDRSDKMFIFSTITGTYGGFLIFKIGGITGKRSSDNQKMIRKSGCH